MSTITPLIFYSADPRSQPYEKFLVKINSIIFSKLDLFTIEQSSLRKIVSA